MKFVVAVIVLIALYANALNIPKVVDGVEPTYNFFVVMKDSINMDMLAKAAYNMTRDEHGIFVHQSLLKFAEKSQSSIKKVLEDLNVSYKSFWISNSIFVENVKLSVLKKLAAREDVLEIRPNLEVRANPIKGDVAKSSNQNVQENIRYIHAPEVWAQGFDGTGVYIAVVDTGVQYDHVALNNNYAGFKSDGSYDHNYNWYDGVKSGSGSSCGYQLKVPCDDHGHGTHCTGTACGYGEGIGVAPKAKFRHCRSMSRGSGTLQQILDCLQWLVAPTDVDGKNPDPTKRSHVSSHSYGFSGNAGAEFHRATEAVVAAGIFFVAAAGNSGNFCGSLRGDPAKLDAVFSIGALGRMTNVLASFSSVGPTPTSTIKPNICAPGSSIFSSVPTNRFQTMSGTSMACPTVAGSIALFLTEGKGKPRDVQVVQNHFQQHAIQRPANVCGSSGVPNNYYGYGNLDCQQIILAKN
jgi:subtilisin family serine protease